MWQSVRRVLALGLHVMAVSGGSAPRGETVGPRVHSLGRACGSASSAAPAPGRPPKAAVTRQWTWPGALGCLCRALFRGEKASHEMESLGGCRLVLKRRWIKGRTGG